MHPLQQPESSEAARLPRVLRPSPGTSLLLGEPSPNWGPPPLCAELVKPSSDQMCFVSECLVTVYGLQGVPELISGWTERGSRPQTTHWARDFHGPCFPPEEQECELSLRSWTTFNHLCFSPFPLYLPTRGRARVSRGESDLDAVASLLLGLYSDL